jgi:tryptophanyl-tRNA synthetase
MRKRVLTGYRPTGKLHLGHLFGNLQEMVKLQEEYECFFFIADWHALTTDYADPSSLPENTREMLLDWLTAGLDPEKCVIYRQSDFPEVAELTLYFGMVTPLSWLERCPTYKEQLRELKGREITTYGFLGYPVLMAADILIMRAELVPVGEDQLPHLELTREIARRFNGFYGDYFPEPQALLSKAQRVPGIDGRKMSKSYGNAIFLTDTPELVREKVSNMFTDPARIRKTDLGHPEVCAVFALHKLYSQNDIKEIEEACRKAQRGCVECKKILAERISENLSDFQKKRRTFEKEKDVVKNLLERGQERAKPIAQETLLEVRKRLKLLL